MAAILFRKKRKEKPKLGWDTTWKRPPPPSSRQVLIKHPSLPFWTSFRFALSFRTVVSRFLNSTLLHVHTRGLRRANSWAAIKACMISPIVFWRNLAICSFIMLTFCDKFQRDSRLYQTRDCDQNQFGQTFCQHLFFQRVFTCKNRRRYSRERATRSLGEIIQYYLIVSLVFICWSMSRQT